MAWDAEELDWDALYSDQLPRIEANTDVSDLAGSKSLARGSIRGVARRACGG